MIFSQRKWFSGSALVFMSEALALPTGLATAAFLSRQLGPAGYGYLVLAATLVSWVEWSVSALFSRASFKLLSEREDWQPFAATILRLHLAIGLACAAVFWLLSDFLANVFHEPALATYLRLFSIEIPLFCLARGYRNVLVSTGEFRPRAVVGGIYWIGRFVLIIALVGGGLGLSGAIWGMIAANAIELLFAFRYLKISWWRGAAVSLGSFWRYSFLLFFSATSRRIYQRIDLFALKHLGGSAAQAGFYGAAQNLMMLSAVFMTSFSPLLLSTVSNLLSKKRCDEATRITRNALRLALALLPLAAIVAGSVNEIVPLVFGEAFREAIPVFRILVFGEIGAILISLSTAVMVAKGHPRQSLYLNAGLIILVLPGFWHWIPRFEMTGAAGVAAGGSLVGAVLGILAAQRLLPGIFPWKTALRSTFIAAIGYFFASAWQVSAWMVFIKLPLLGVLVAVLFLAAKELSLREIAKIAGIFNPGKRLA